METLSQLMTPSSPRKNWTAEESAIALESGSSLRCWRHLKTGARVRLMTAPGPMCNLYAVVSTEAVTNSYAHADDGLPHTLEHLVFLGSQDYPYKGVLDKLANRCLARGTNAWTDVDHTAYTATTAGSGGLLALLPIYVDHVLRPTLSDAGFLTEVHHVTGDGEDKGVVYCEMLGRETTAESLAERKCLGALYPDCGYSSETGGICANLRSLANAQVRRYHSEFYRPSNLCLVVTGGVDADALLAACDAALTKSAPEGEGSSSSQNDDHRRQRPWTSPVLPLTSGARLRLEFPAADGDDAGLVVLAWRGNRYGSYFEDAKQGMLWSYLADGAAAPLTKAFVNAGDCSGVWPTSDKLRVGYRQLWFEDVAVAKLEMIEAKFDAVISSISEVDVTRMKDVVSRAKRRAAAALEDDPATAIVTHVLKHFLYADDPDDVETLADAVDPLELLEMVEKVDAEEWKRCFDDLFRTEKPRVVVIATPSSKRAIKERNDERDRIVATRDALGDAGLLEKSKILELAVEENERPPPKELLEDAVQTPDIKEALDLMFHVIKVEEFTGSSTASSRRRRRCLRVDGTKFCRVDLAAPTSNLPRRLRQYLPLLSELLFTSPALRRRLTKGDDVLVPYEDVVEELRRETVSYGAGTGLAGSGTSDLFFVGAKLQKENRAFGAKLAKTAVVDAQIDDLDRLKAAVSKLSLEYNSELRDGASAARAALRAATFAPTATNVGLLLVAPQKLLLDDVKFALSPLGRLAGKRSKVLKDLADLRGALFDDDDDDAPKNEVSACVSGDLTTDEALSLLADLPGGSSRSLSSLSSSETTKNGAYGRYVASTEAAAWGRRVFVGVPALEGGSAFLARCAPGPDMFDVEELAALSVVIEYLTALEGDFWTKIRGTGLAYGAGLRADGASNLVHFSLYRSADPAAALAAARDVVFAYADGSARLRRVDFENARGSLASGLVEREKTRSSAIAAAYRRALLGVPNDANLHFIDAVAKVDAARALLALRTYLVPLFQDHKANTAVSCAPAKLDDFQRKLEDNDDDDDSEKKN